MRERLPALHVRPERENEIVAELALQLEQAYADAIAGGAGEDEALAPRAGAVGRLGQVGARNRRLRTARRIHRGRDARSALRAALLPAEPGLHGDRDVDAGVRHRRQYGHLHDGGRAGAARTALPGAGAADGDRDAEGAAAGDRTLDIRAGFLRLPGAVAGVLLDGGDQPGLECGDDGAGPDGAAGRALRFGGILPDARRQRRDGPHLLRRRRTARRSLRMWWCCRTASGSGASAAAATRWDRA